MVPDYFNGTLRVMAVAVADDRVGVHEGRTLVRGDFVLSPNAPTTVTPGDEFDVSVGVANNVEGSGAERADRRDAADRSRRSKSSATARSRRRSPKAAKARCASGCAHATSSGPRISRSPRAPATPARRAHRPEHPAGDAVHDADSRPACCRAASARCAIDRTLYPQHRTLEAGVSMLPLQFAHGFVSYLGELSVRVYRADREPGNAGGAARRRARSSATCAPSPARTSPGSISELRARQNDAGAYKLWPGSDQVVEFVSLYAQHLLLEAAERGEPVPGDLIANGNNYLRSVAARDGNNLTDERQSAYAIYLLTRQGQRMSAEIAALRKRLDERYRGQWEQDLTAAWLAAALDLMRQDRDAGQLIGRMQVRHARQRRRHLQRSDDARCAAAVRDRATFPGAPARRAAAKR